MAHSAFYILYSGVPGHCVQYIVLPTAKIIRTTKFNVSQSRSIQVSSNVQCNLRLVCGWSSITPRLFNPSEKAPAHAMSVYVAMFWRFSAQNGAGYKRTLGRLTPLGSRLICGCSCPRLLFLDQHPYMSIYWNVYYKQIGLLPNERTTVSSCCECLDLGAAQVLCRAHVATDMVELKSHRCLLRCAWLRWGMSGVQMGSEMIGGVFQSRSCPVSRARLVHRCTWVMYGDVGKWAEGRNRLMKNWIKGLSPAAW